MEYRNDLADVLLSGLSDGERSHVVETINRVDAEKLRRKRASSEPAMVGSGEESGYEDDTD